MQTILGSGGAIGTELAKELPKYTREIRLVSRNPKKVNPSDELMPADLMQPEEVNKAVEGSDITYVTIGFEYKTKVWEKQWVPFMKNVVEACKKQKSKLVFFDNVYMYDPAHIQHMTEETPVNPSSKKGAVRMKVADMIMQEVEKGNLTALIARSADFFGLKNSLLTEMVIKNLKKGKKANWLVDVNKIHNFTYIPDAAKGTAILGNTPEAFNQIWHLPTDQQKLTVKDWIDLIAEELNTSPRYTILPKWLMSPMGIFVPVLKEVKEMSYQYDRDYFFDSSKFDKRFSYQPVKPEEGIREVIKKLEVRR